MATTKIKKPSKNDIAANVALLSLRLMSSAYKSPPSIVPSQAKGEVWIGIDTRSLQSQPEETGECQILVLVVYSAFMIDKAKKKHSRSPFEIRTTYELIFHSDSSDWIDEKSIQVLERQISIDLTYPYWREFSHDALRRMDLDPLPLPIAPDVDRWTKKSPKTT